MFTRIVGLYIFSSLITTVSAASFNCDRAHTDVEHMICDTPSLSDSDSRMADLYASAKVDGRTTVVDQRNWLKYTRNKCTNIDCLEYVYKTRIEALSQSSPTYSIANSGETARSTHTQSPKLGGIGLGDEISSSQYFEYDFGGDFLYKGDVAPFDNAVIEAVETGYDIKKVKHINYYKTFRDGDRQHVLNFFSHARNKLSEKYGEFSFEMYENGYGGYIETADLIIASNKNTGLSDVEEVQLVFRLNQYTGIMTVRLSYTWREEKINISGSDFSNF